ncbi:MAG: cell division protein FtsZ [Alphaproteobacteria bacterium]
MSINLQMPDIRELKPRITVFGVGGAGCNAVNNMIEAGLEGVDFVVANTDAQALTMSKAERLVQMGVAVTEGLGAGSQPEIGRAAAEETIDEIKDYLSGSHMVFITAGMGGGTGTGAAPVVAKAAREAGILTVGVVTKPFQFEGQRRMRIAEGGIEDLQKHVDTLIVIPNQNLFRIANEKTTFADAFAMADEVLYSGVACITDLMVKDGLINLDFADVRSVMREMGKAMMGTGEASGDKRAVEAAEAAISNPLLDEVSMRGARGLLISVTGGHDMTLFEVDEAASRVREEVDDDASIIFGATFDEKLDGTIRVSVVSTGIDPIETSESGRSDERMAELTRRLRTVGTSAAEQVRAAAPASTPARAPAAASAPAAISAPVAAAASSASDDLERELQIPQLADASKDGAPKTAAERAAVREERPAETGTPDIRLERYKPDPSLVAARSADLDVPVAPPVASQPQTFVPPRPQQVEERAPRMPQVEDFPAVAQRQLRGGQGADEARKPRGLLARLAQNLAHREGSSPAPVAREPQLNAAHGQQQNRPAAQRPAPAHAARSAPEAPAAPAAPAQQAPMAGNAAEPAAKKAMSEFAKPQPRRMGEAPPASGDLDRGGRPALKPIHRDDELEIPAFLRRSAS